MLDLFLNVLNLLFSALFSNKTALLLTNQNGEIFSCILLDMKTNKKLNKLKQRISGCLFFDSLETLLSGIHLCRTIQSVTRDTVSSFVATTDPFVSLHKVLKLLFICVLSFPVIFGIFLFVG